MGIMNFLKRANHATANGSAGAEAPTSSAETSTPNVEAPVSSTETTPPRYRFDDEAARLAQATAERERQAQQNRNRQENKLIWLFSTRNDHVLNQNPPAASDAQREQVYQNINDGIITPAVESQVLQGITPPYGRPGEENYDPVIVRIGDKHGLKILSYATGVDVKSVNRIRDDETINDYYKDLLRRLTKTYPTPVEFAERERAMLDDLRRSGNHPSKIAEYEKDFDRFKQSVYGKRYEYHQAYQQLAAKADLHSRQQSERAKVLNAIHGANIPGNNTNGANTHGANHLDDTQPIPAVHASQKLDQLEQNRVRREASQNHEASQNRGANQADQDDTELLPRPAVEVSFIMEPESRELLRTGQIDGDPFTIGGQSYQLTPGHIEAAGLEPKYKFELDGKTSVALSKLYRAEDRDAVMAYVTTDKGTKIVSYYRSNSQGTWRYLPDYVGEPQGHETTGMDWFGKGYSEESLNLPVATQEALEIVSRQPRAENIGFNTSFLLAGTAKRYASKDEYRHALHTNSLRGNHYAEVSSQPELDLGRPGYDKKPPESLQLPSQLTPDFSQSSSNFILQSPIYGKATSEHYKSADGKFLWTFNRDQANRAWIGGVEVQSPFSSAGLRTKWGQIGDYGTPLYEYKSQDGSYGDRTDIRKGYVCMWKNYLSKVPVIRQYLETPR